MRYKPNIVINYLYSNYELNSKIIISMADIINNRLSILLGKKTLLQDMSVKKFITKGIFSKNLFININQ